MLRRDEAGEPAVEHVQTAGDLVAGEDAVGAHGWWNLKLMK